MLKRSIGRVLDKFRVLIAWMLIAAPPLIIFILARRFALDEDRALIAAVGILPALAIVWYLGRGLGKLGAIAGGFLWKRRWFRYGFLASVFGVGLAGTVWIVRASGELAWIALIFEGAGVAALAAAIALAATPPERLAAFAARVRMRVPLWLNRPLRATRVLLWFAGIALVDLWLYAAVVRRLGENWIELPWAPVEGFRVALALLPPIVFTVAALFARPPYLRRAPPRWVWRLWEVSDERREQSRKMFGRIPHVSLGRVRKMVSTVMWDGRRAEVGERFVVWRMLCVGTAFVTAGSVLALSIAADRFTAGLPSDLSSVEAYQPVVSTRAFDRTGRLMCTFTLENRVYVPLADVPKHVQDAFKAAEDKSFDEHDGIDPNGIIRAGLVNFQSGRSRQGASTLDQQVIKQIVLKDSSKSYVRKLSEILLAVRLEDQMTAKYGREGAKAKILEVYLNHVYLGKNAYGVEAAAETYFGKSVKELTLAEASILAGLPKAPSDDSPDGHFDRAKARQRYVLARMLENGTATQAEVAEALAENIVIVRRPHQLNATAAPFDCENVRKWAESTFGYDAVYKRGLDITTTFDLALQEKAQAAVRYGLLDLERRLGFAGPEGRDEAAGDRCDGPEEHLLDNAVEANARVIARAGTSITLCLRGNRLPLDPDDADRVVKWERAKPGRALSVGALLTVRIETRKEGSGEKRYALTARRTGGPEHPEALQAALVAIDPGTGEIRAIVGSYNWNESQYDNATQAHRQTGSSIKPYIYLTALMGGETVVSTVLDAPICLQTATGKWCPSNYSNAHMSRSYYGTVDMMTALAKSLNSVSVRLLVDVGLDKALATIRALGVRSPIVRVFPIAVGSPELTLLEHTAAYASILSNGRAMPVQHLSGAGGRFVTKVTERVRGDDGTVAVHVVYVADPRPERQAVPAGDAYAMTHLMKGVVEFGTGSRAKKLRRPVAGKTGTTNSFRDVWFMGGTADLTVGVWVGRKTPQPIAKEATGGSIALPIWEGFMEAAFPVPADGKSFATPPRDFPIPDDVTLVDRGETRGGAPVLIPFQRGKTPDAYLTSPEADFGSGGFD